MISQQVRIFRLRQPFRALCAVASDPGNASLFSSNSLGLSTINDAQRFCQKVLQCARDRIFFQTRQH